MTTRFTVSLPDEDAEVLDAFIRDRGLAGRSAGIQAAIHAISTRDLEHYYEAAFAADDGTAWDVVTADA